MVLGSDGAKSEWEKEVNPSTIDGITHGTHFMGLSGNIPIESQFLKVFGKMVRMFM